MRIKGKGRGSRRAIRGIFAICGAAAACLFGMSGAADAVVATPSSAPAIGAPGLDARSAGAFFDDYLSKRTAKGDVAGAVAVVVADGGILFEKGYGYADLEGRKAVDPERTLFSVGSLSKVFCWTAVMQLVEKGLIDLDKDVNDYLDFEIPATFTRPITMANLMAHNAGFEDRCIGQMSGSDDSLPSLGDWLRTHMPARIRPRGELSAYGNYGAALAGYIVERASGLPYADYVEKNIFAPLGMARTTGRQPAPGSLLADLSKGYYMEGGQLRPWMDEVLGPAPAGAVKASAADIGKFMIAHLSGGGTLLRPATEALMLTRSFSGDPRVNGWAHGLMEMDMGGERIVGHAGSTFVFNSLMMLYPARGVGVFVATNSAAGADFLGNGYFAMRRAFTERFFPAAGRGAAGANAPDAGAPAAGGSDAAASDPAPSDAAAYEGFYRQTMGENRTTAEKLFSLIMGIRLRAEGGELVATLPAGEARFLPEAPGVFREEGAGDALVFKAGSNGRTVAFYGAAPLTALEKEYFWESPWIPLVLLGLSLAAFVGYLLAAPVVALARRAGRRKGCIPAPRAYERIGAWLGVAAGAAGLMVAAFAMLTIMDKKGLFLAQLPLWGLVGPLAFLESLISGGMVVCLVFIWKNKAWTLPLRILYSVMLAAVLLFGGLREYLRWTGGGL